MRPWLKKIISVVFVAGVVLTLHHYFPIQLTDAATTPTFVRAWGKKDFAYTMDPFTMAVSTQRGQQGLSIYVTDAANGMIDVFDDSGNFLFNFDAPGQSVAIAPNGNVYVANTEKDRVDVYTADGVKLFQFGENGGTDGTFTLLRGVAVSSTGTVFTASGGGGPRGGNTFQKVQAFDAQGNFLYSWGSTGSGAGQFMLPTYVAVDASDHVYVTDGTLNTVQEFDSLGNYIRTFGTGTGSGDGELSAPQGVTFDEGGNVYIADRDNGRIEVFDIDGNYLDEFGNSPTNDGVFNSPTDVRHYLNPLGVSAQWYVLDHGNGDIQIFTDAAPVGGGAGVHTIPAKNYTSRFSHVNTPADGTFYFPKRAAVGPNGGVYVADSNNFRIEEFDQSGAFVNAFGSEGPGNGEFQDLADVAVADDGRIYALDQDRVEIFDDSGSYLSQFGTSGSGDGEFSLPKGIAIHGGTIYVADNGNNRIEAFDANGNYMSQFGTNGTADGELNDIRSVAVAPDGTIYVADNGNSRVQAFDPSGVYRSQFGISGSGGGEFSSVDSIAVGQNGIVYVLDSGNSRVQGFAPDGSFLFSFGSQGFGDGKFDQPLGIAIGSEGALYVVDTNNNRIEEFQTSATAPAAPSITSPGVTVTPPLSVFSGTGEADATVTVTENGATVCTAPVATDGSWTCTAGTPYASEGTHVFSVTQTDTDYNTSPATTITVTIANPSSGGNGGGNPPAPVRQNHGYPIVTNPVPVATTCASEQQFIQYLKQKDRNPEVIKVQVFLAKLGLYAGPIDAIFGPLTKQGVKGFQEDHSMEILTPWGLAKGTGTWAQATRAYANKLIGCPEGPVQLTNGATVDFK